MILTLTLNPSVDISYPLTALKLDDVNRVQEVSKTAGGKGLNVTRVLAQVGEPVLASGFIGGELGQLISVLNPVGSGDSTVAGITSAILNHENDHDLLKKANTLGMLNAQEAQTGYVNLNNYDDLFNQIEVLEV